MHKSLGERWGRLWTGRQSITEPLKDKQDQQNTQPRLFKFPFLQFDLELLGNDPFVGLSHCRSEVKHGQGIKTAWLT